MRYTSDYRGLATIAAERLIAGAPADGFSFHEELIVASAGFGEAVARELLARVPAGVAGLRVQTLETFARRLLNERGEYPRVASAEERRLAMRTATRSIPDPIMESRGIASMLERAYRDIRDSGLSIGQLDSRLGAMRGFRNRERLQLILKAWREYERLIARLGAIDPADLFHHAIRALEHPSPRQIAPQIVAGFYDMTGVQLALVTALSQAERLAAILIPIDPAGGEPYTFAQNFLARFASLESVDARTSTNKSWSVSEHTTSFEELRAACESIAALLRDGADPATIGIVARSLDPHDIQLLNRFARELGFATTRREELPLTTQRLARGIATLIRLRERGFQRHEVLELLRDGLRTRTRLPNVDSLDRDTRAGRISAGPSAELRAIRRRSRTVDDYIALVAELESLTEPLAIPMRGDEWADFLLRAIELFPAGTEADLAGAACIEETAALLRRTVRWRARFDVGSIVSLLEESTATLADPASSTTENRPTIFLGDVMQFRGRSFQHLFAVRMQDDLFPQRRVEDPLLTDSDRRLLGLREIGTGREEERLLFQLLFDGTEALHFSFAGGDGFGKVLRPSQLLKNFVVDEYPHAKQEVLENFSRFIAEHVSRPPALLAKEQRTASTRQLQLLASSGTSSVFDGYLRSEELRGYARAALRSVTPTQLEDFGECPHKFLLKHILGVRDVDDPERELQINHREKGTIDHRILERFYRGMDDVAFAQAESDLPRLPKEAGKRLEAIIDDEFDKLEEIAPPFNRTMRDIERRATKRILRDFVVSDLADLRDQELMPRWFEYRFGSKYQERGGADHPEPFTIDAPGLPIRVEGQIDRIDAGAGTFRIIDYKSGKALRHKNLGKKIDRGVRLQLALYAMAVSEFFGADPSTIRAAIKPLVIDTTGDTRPNHFAFELGEKRETLVETLDLFVASIARGLFPAFPNEKDEEFNSCKYCPVNHSCRIKHEPEERYAVAQSKEPRALLQALMEQIALGEPSAEKRERSDELGNLPSIETMRRIAEDVP